MKTEMVVAKITTRDNTIAPWMTRILCKRLLAETMGWEIIGAAQ